MARINYDEEIRKAEEKIKRFKELKKEQELKDKLSEYDSMLKWMKETKFGDTSRTVYEEYTESKVIHEVYDVENVTQDISES